MADRRFCHERRSVFGECVYDGRRLGKAIARPKNRRCQDHGSPPSFATLKGHIAPISTAGPLAPADTCWRQGRSVVVVVSPRHDIARLWADGKLGLVARGIGGLHL